MEQYLELMRMFVSPRKNQSSSLATRRLKDTFFVVTRGNPWVKSKRI